MRSMLRIDNNHGLSEREILKCEKAIAKCIESVEWANGVENLWSIILGVTTHEFLHGDLLAEDQHLVFEHFNTPM